MNKTTITLTTLAAMHALQLIHKPYDLEFPSRLATPAQVVDAHAKK